MVGIDLFSGAGGMSLGATWAGVKVHFAVDSSVSACRTYAKNHAKVAVLNKPVESLNLRDFRGLQKGKEVILFGGPPCQGFSTSNQRTRDKNNPKNWLFKAYIDAVKMIRPDWVLFENVTGIAQTEKGYFLKRVQSELADAGFDTVLWVLNALHYGVPQSRSRLFLVGNRFGGKLKAPNDSRRRVTVADAILDLPVLSNGACENWLPYPRKADSCYAKAMRGRMSVSSNHVVTRNAPFVIRRYEYVPPGGNWESIPLTLMQNYADPSACHEWIYRRLRLDEPSVVIGNYRKNMLIHPTQHRGLSVREAARLQSFPDWFDFEGSIGIQQQQVGNAVPPLLARAVFRAIMDS